MASSVLILLQLCSLQLMVIAMPTCRLSGNVVKNAHQHLRDLGGSFPIDCVSHNANVSFPSSALPAPTANRTQCRTVLWVVYKSLEEAESVFAAHDTPVGEGGVTWDEQKLEDFQLLQDRLLEDGKCLSRAGSSGILASYFRNVTDVLQDSAVCGWSALKRDLFWVLRSALHDHHDCFAW